jgi:hypothetical protein
MLRSEVAGYVVFFEDCHGFIADETQWLILYNCEKVLPGPFIFENTAL